MHQVRTCLCLDAIASCLSRRHGWVAENNFSPVALDGFGFHGGGVPGHDNPRRNSTPRSRASYGSAMITARLRNDALCRLSLGQRKDCIRRTANFEGTGFLQVFALEEEMCSGHGVQRCGRQNWRAVDTGRDARVRRKDGLPTGWLVVRCFDGWGCAHKVHFVLGKAGRFLTFSAFFSPDKEALWHADPGHVRACD